MLGAGARAKTKKKGAGKRLSPVARIKRAKGERPIATPTEP